MRTDALSLPFLFSLLPRCCHLNANAANNLLLQASIRPKLDEGDIWFVLRKDARKAARGLELLKAKDDAKRYRNVIEQPENINADYVVDMIQVNQDPAAVATGAAAAPVDAAAQPAADAGGYDEGDYVL